MSEFMVLVELVAKIVSYLFNLSLDGICTVFLVAACVLPWRCCEIIVYFRNESHRDDYRFSCCLSLFLTVLDMFVIPISLVGLLSPLRWCQIYWSFKPYRLSEFSTHLKPREYLVLSAVGAVTDIVCFFAGMMILFSLYGRQCVVYRFISLHYAASNISDINRGSKAKQYFNFMLEIEMYVFHSSVSVIIDHLTVLPFLCTCFIPFNWYSFGMGLSTLIKQQPEVATTVGGVAVPPNADEWRVWVFYFDDVRVHFLFHALRSVIDLVAAPFYLLATISPLRSSLLRREIKEILAARDEAQSRILSEVSVFEYRYCWDVRKTVFSLGTLALADLLLLPMLLPLFLTQYRYKSIRNVLVGEEASKIWGFREFSLIAAQFSLQLLDLLILAPCLPLVLLSAVRWKPIGKMLDRPDVFVEHSLDLYALTVTQLSLVVLDLLTLPFTLIVLFTHYRSKPVKQCWTSHVIWYQDPLSFHYAVLFNFLIILFDVCIMFPVMLILILVGFHRVPIVVDEMYSQWHLDFHRTSFDSRELTEQPMEQPMEPQAEQDVELSVVYQAVPEKIDWIRSVGGPSESSLGEIPIEPEELEHNQPSDVPSAPPMSPEVHRIESQRETSPPAPPQQSLPIAGTDAVRDAAYFGFFDERPLSQEQMMPTSRVEFGVTNTIRVLILFQLLFSLVDCIFSAIALFLLFTVWRAYDMLDELKGVWKMAKVNQKGRWKAYNNLLRHYYEELCSVIGNQFKMFWIDVLCLIPLSLVVATLYRLPSLLTTLLGKLSSKPLSGLTHQPLFLVETCEVIQPETGGPTVQLTLKHNPKAAVVSSLDPSAPVEFYVVGNRMFDALERTMGSLVVNVARALLPVKLRESTKTVGWDAFLEELRGDIELTDDERKDHTYKLWVRLDLSKTTKKSSIIKKLKQLGNATVIDLQLECYGYNANGMRSKEMLLKLSPRVEDMLTAIEDTECGPLPLSCFNVDIVESSNSTNDRKGNFVNSFHLVVLMELKELLVDAYYCILFFGSMMSPYRFVKLIWMILESDSALPVRMMEESMQIVNHLDRHVQEFKLAEAPKLNAMVKAQLEYDLGKYYQVKNNANQNESTLIPTPSSLPRRRRSFDGYYYSFFYLMYDFNVNGAGVYDRGVREQIEAAHIKPYRNAVIPLKKALNQVDRCELMIALLNARIDLHDRMMQLFFTRVACSAQLLGCYSTDSQETNTTQANNYNVAMSLLTQDYDAVIVSLMKNRKEMLDEIERRKHDHKTGGSKGWLGRCGLFKRSQRLTRWMIKRAFSQACTDVGILALTLTLLLTLVRAVPLVRDLWRHHAWNVAGYRGKLIVRRHLSELFYDLVNIARLLMFQFILIVTVAGLPSYLVSAPKHFSSFRDAADCAEKHCKYILWYFCELFALVFAFKTYRIFFRASLFVLLVPGACVAEAISFTGFDTHARFAVGFAAWIGLLAGSIRTVVIAFNAGTIADSNSTTPWYADSSLLMLCGCLLVVLLLAVVSLLQNKSLLTPDRHASRSFEMTWSHLMSMFCGPLESLQLSAVVMFFYWSGRTDSDRPLVLGTDNFSSPFMVWGDAYEGSSHGYFASSSLATTAILVWSLVVSIPMALNNANSSPVRNWEKASQFKNSAAYQFIVNMISRLFSVWIMATLMRTVSCYYSGSSVTGIGGAAVLSTAADVACGGDHTKSLWSSRLSLALFTYFIITSAVLHSDDYTFMQLNEQYGGGSVKDPQDSLVKFSPLYVLLVKVVQLFVCAACFGGFYAASSVGPLVAILIVSLLMSLVPLLLTHEACSLAMITPLRSAGFLCVAWTTIVCLARSANRDGEGILRFESFVYVGWGIIYGLALIAMAAMEWRQRILWEERIRASGLNEAIEKLIVLVNSAFVDNALMKTNQNGVLMPASMSNVIRDEVRCARSTTQLARVLLFLEDLISAERLTIPFLIDRTRWIGRLKSTAMVEEELQAPTMTGHRESLRRYERASEELRRSSHSYDDNLEVQEISEDDPTVGRGSGGERLSLGANGAVTAVITPQFKLILSHITQLSSGLRPSRCLSQFSRNVFTILLSNRLPRDVCWEIYGYLVDPQIIRRILQMTDDEVGCKEDRYYYRFSRNCTWPKLETKPSGSELYNENMLRYAMSFVANRRELIFSANTKHNQWELEDKK